MGVGCRVAYAAPLRTLYQPRYSIEQHKTWDRVRVDVGGRAPITDRCDDVEAVLAFKLDLHCIRLAIHSAPIAIAFCTYAGGV